VEPPVFGAAPAGVVCHPRPAAYVVVRAPDGRVAAIRAVAFDGTTRCWLPGGAAKPDESPETTVGREVLEELGRAVRLTGRIGDAVQRFYAVSEQRWYEMTAVFFRGEFDGEPIGAGSDELYWLDPTRECDAFFHAGHAWAASQVE